MTSYQYVYVMDKLSKTYPGGKQVLKDIRLSFLPGVKIGIVGVNGAGKSSTFKCLAADEHLSGGEIKVNGIEIQSKLCFEILFV